MNTVLHATDLSAPAINALEQAHAWSRALGARLVVVHVFDIPTIMNSPTKAATFQQIDKDVHRIDLARLEAFCREHLGAAAMDQGVRCQVKEHTAPVEAILEVAEAEQADLVVVGARGQSRVREMIMGSTAKGLAKQCTRPLLVVPEGASSTLPKLVVHATVLIDAEAGILEKSLRICDALKASLSVVHVAIPEADHAADQLAHLVADVEQRTGRSGLHHEVVRAASAAEGLDAHLRAHPADLLVIVEHERHGLFDLLFHRDAVPSMLFHTHIPTMVLHQGWPIA